MSLSNTAHEFFASVSGFQLSLPLYQSEVACGFPSPADDYIEKTLDLNELIVKKPASTFFVRVKGDSMKEAGIVSGDLLVIDRSRKAVHRSIVLAALDGEFTVKRLFLRNGRPELHAENKNYQPIRIGDESQFEIYGVVTFVIHEAK